MSGLSADDFGRALGWSVTVRDITDRKRLIDALARQVAELRVSDGGHAWPGGGPLVGKTSTDIDATNTIIDFFEKHPMP